MRGGQKPSACWFAGEWNVIPKRLALSEEPGLRRFFSHWNVFQCEWAASDWSDEVRAQIPRGYL